MHRGDLPPIQFWSCSPHSLHLKLKLILGLGIGCFTDGWIPFDPFLVFFFIHFLYPDWRTEERWGGKQKKNKISI